LGVHAGGHNQSDYQEEQHEHERVKGQATQGKYEQLQRSADGACALHVRFLVIERFPNVPGRSAARGLRVFYAVTWSGTIDRTSYSRFLMSRGRMNPDGNHPF